MSRYRASIHGFGLIFSLVGIGLVGCNGDELSGGGHGAAPGAPLAVRGADDDGSVNAPPEVVAAAREVLAARTGQPADSFTITNAGPATFPLQGVLLYGFKATDTRGNALSVTLSEDGSREEDFGATDAREQALYLARNGRLTPDLAARIDGLPDDAALDVAIQAVVPDGADAGAPARPDPSARLSEADVDQLYARVDANRAQVARQVVAPIQARLRAMGRDGEADTLAPIVHVRGFSVGDLRAAARWDDVAKIFADEVYEPTLEVARAVVESDIVNSRGFSGSGMRVAEIEVGGIYAAGNPFLAGSVQDPTFACASAHATWVAGTIRSTHPTVRGMAPSVLLRVAGSCGGVSAQLSNRSSVASSWGARAFNLSFGSTAGTQPGALDNYYDDLVQNGWRTVVASAGNSGAGAIVVSPARAYNVISVGAINDNNTIPWLGDVMATFSSANDPVSTWGDREKPEVAAPGTNIHTTSPTPTWVNDIVSGTSFSAPITTGSAALLMQRSPALQVWPEAVKSIMMSTAIHNVEGATRLSDRDGAGVIVDSLADDIAHGVSGNWGARSYSCAEPFSQVLLSMSLISNRVTRVTMAWDTNPSYGFYASRPSADLDMTVFDPFGNPIAGSGSFDNTYEIAEFTAPVTGVYTVRVTKYRCDLTPKWLGWAWYQRY